MTPKLSICIPTYNRAKTLGETLDSILPQVLERPDIEILISDNASTDDTIDCVHEYQLQCPMIRYSRNCDNLGLNGNIIACIEQANGEYISFVSDDDIVPDGMFIRLKNEISAHNPSIMYLNHHPFLNNDPLKKMPPLLPSEDRLFNDGKAFFLFCGLGFISALTIQTDIAREFLIFAKQSLFGQAHLEIATRVALSQKGPFIFLGTISIAARVPSELSDDYVTCHALNPDKFYLELGREGLLDKKSIDYHMKSSIRHLPKKILYNKCVGNYKSLKSQKNEISSVYGPYMSYYFYILPLLTLPRWFLRPPYIILRSISRSLRHFKYA